MIPRVTGGKCIIVEDELYYLGGIIGIPNISISQYNKQLFKLNLKKGVKLIGNIAEWEIYNVTNSPTLSYFTSPLNKMFYIGNKTLVHFDQYKSDPILAYTRFDIEKKEWYGEYAINELYHENVINFSEKDSIQYTGLFNTLQDERNLNKFYIANVIDVPTLPTKLISFDIQTKEMKTVYESSRGSEIYLQFIYDNKLYFYEQLREIEQSMTTRGLYQLDLESYRIEQYNITYRKDMGPPEIIFNDSAYFVFDYGRSAQVEIAEFQIQSLSYRPVKKTVIFESRGCFTNYRNYLISSFGYYLVATEQFSNYTNNYVTFNSSESSNKVQIYNLTNWEQVDGIAPTNENEGSSHTDSITSNNSNSLIEGITGGILVMILIVSIVLFLVHRHQFSKKRAPSFIIDPIHIKPMNPLDCNNEYYNAEIFSHSQEIDNVITMLPIDMHIEALKATDINKERASQ
ncbi:hypothetical protein K502DRAFT_325545 [Neoconidiobolus thromboides FSU 785]|nr:hypothetical protein K502DRAFT_325545 [Neoconidiobolus thromboides FSU 785]